MARPEPPCHLHTGSANGEGRGTGNEGKRESLIAFLEYGSLSICVQPEKLQRNDSNPGLRSISGSICRLLQILIVLSVSEILRCFKLAETFLMVYFTFKWVGVL